LTIPEGARVLLAKFGAEATGEPYAVVAAVVRYRSSDH
jgi:hypothetical protein